jgi:hypothetical protein
MKYELSILYDTLHEPLKARRGVNHDELVAERKLNMASS